MSFRDCKMKILLCTKVVYPFHGYGGMEKYVYFLAKSLKDLGHDVDIISSSIGNTKIVNKRYNNINYILCPSLLRGIPVPIQLIRYHYMIFNIATYIRKENYDVAHCFGLPSLYYQLFFKKSHGTAILTQAFDNESYKIELWKRMLLFFPINFPLKRCMRMSEAVASCGHHQEEEIEKIYGVENDKIKRIGAGVEAKKIIQYTQPLRKNMIENRRKLKIPPDSFVIINVNRLAVTKNVEMIIDALAIVRDKIDFKFILVGTGPEENKIVKRVKFHNLQEEFIHLKNIPNDRLYSYLAIADLFVEASKIENYVTTALEAMAAGLAVVSFHDQEGLLFDKKNGFICKEHCANALANCIIEAHRSTRLREIGLSGQRSVIQNDWSRVAENAVSAYQYAISKKVSE